MLRLTLDYGVGRFHRRQVCDDSDIIISVGTFNVDVDGALNLSVQAGDRARWVGDVGQAALTIVSTGGRDTKIFPLLAIRSDPHWDLFNKYAGAFQQASCCVQGHCNCVMTARFTELYAVLFK